MDLCECGHDITWHYDRAILACGVGVEPTPNTGRLVPCPCPGWQPQENLTNEQPH